MRQHSKFAVVWSLAFLVGGVVSAQTDKPAGSQSKDQGTNAQPPRDSDPGRARDRDRDRDRTETIRGELAGATVVGETMVDSSSGRGVVAEFTYLTILGSPADSGRDRGRDGQDKADRNRGDRDRADRDNAKDRGDRDRPEQSSARGRRTVYQIAIAPDTRIRDRSSQAGRDSGDRKDEAKGSDRDQTQSALERLELGDRVEVEFTRMHQQGQAGAGAGQGGSATHTRHGRHRIVRGVAKMVTILSTPDQDNDRRGRDGRRGDDSSSGTGRSDSNSNSNSNSSSSSGDKKPDQDQ